VDLDRSFPALVRAHQDWVYSVALRWSGVPAEAEDAAQDAFVRAYRALAGYDDARRDALAVRPWLATIVVNVCRNRWRDDNRRPRTTPMLEDGDPAPSRAANAANAAHAARAAPASAAGPAEAHEAAETAGRLADALRTLSSDQRTAVVLRHCGQLSYREIAATLDRPEGTVKADVHRGLAALRLLLASEEDLS